MVAESYNEKGRRQKYPIGDEEQGQAIQAYKPLPTKVQDIDWVTSEALTVSSTVIGLTHRMVGYDFAKVRIENAPVRFTLDDSNPSTTVGWPLDVGDSLTLSGKEEVKDVRFLRSSGVDSTLTVFYGNRI